MPVPNFEGKHQHDALFSARDMLDVWARHGPIPAAPTGVIFCWTRALNDWVVQTEGESPYIWPTPHHGELYSLRGPGNLVICGRYGQGGPEIAFLVEMLYALGARRFVNIGIAGGLGSNMNIGDFVVCDRAIRDEGTSHHYLEPGQYAYPDPVLTARIAAGLDSAGITYRTGATWTIDAVFRETVAEARHYASEGALTVEMEAATLFAVAQVRGAEAASAFVISDVLLDAEWVPPDRRSVEEPLRSLFNAARAALVG